MDLSQVTVFMVMFLAVLAVMMIRMLSKQDPRSYVLLRQEEPSSKKSSIRNLDRFNLQK